MLELTASDVLREVRLAIGVSSVRHFTASQRPLLKACLRGLRSLAREDLAPSGEKARKRIVKRLRRVLRHV
jgi:hypothetical protein